MIIGISQGKSFWNKLTDPGHAFVMYIDVNNNDNSIMLDASGHYGKNRTSSDVVLGNSGVTISIPAYLSFFSSEKEYLTTFEMKLSEEETYLIKSMIENYDGQRSTWNCANAASSLLKSSGLFENIKNHSTPKGLLKDLNNYYENHKESVIKKEYDFSTGELINE